MRHEKRANPKNRFSSVMDDKAGLIFQHGGPNNTVRRSIFHGLPAQTAHSP